MWYIIGAILIFGLLIMIHELGHFTVARLCGVHIDEFSIGMGPKLFGKRTKKQGTLFSLRLLPIGGYVSMKGENEDVEGDDSFSKKKVWQRMAIVVAGAFMNLVLGFLLVFLLVCLTQSNLPSTTIHSFQEGATSNGVGGLEAGDTVLRVDGVSVYTGNELVYEIMNQGDKPLTLTVLRNGEKIVLENVVFPTTTEQDVVLGMYDFYVSVVENPSIFQLFRHSWHRSLSLVKTVWDSVINLVTGKYSLSALSSPIGVTSAVKDVIVENQMGAKEILNYILNITAMISINLGVFNLIPFPALDGGRFVFLIIEGIRRKPLSQEVEGRIHFVGIILLMAMMLLVVGKDIVSLFF